MKSTKPTTGKDKHSPSQRGLHIGCISQQGYSAIPRPLLRDQKHPQGPSSGWMQSKTERQPCRWSDTQRRSSPSRTKGKRHLQEGQIKIDRGNKKEYIKRKKKGEKKKVEILTIFRITPGLSEAHNQKWGWNPKSNLSVLGASTATLFGLFGHFSNQVLRDLSQKAIYLHASYSRDFSSLWQCLLHWYLRQQIPAPWNQPHSSLTTLASPAMKFNLWHCCTFHLNFHLERSSVWRPCSLSC